MAFSTSPDAEVSVLLTLLACYGIAFGAILIVLAIKSRSFARLLA